MNKAPLSFGARLNSSTPPASAGLLSLLAAILWLLASPAAQAISVTWTNAATAAWTTTTAWNPNGAPVSTNDYLVSGAFTMQNIDAATSTFTNNSVTVQSGATIYLYRSNSGTSISATNYFTNTVAGTVSTLTVSNAVLKLDSSLGSVLHHIKTPILLRGTNTISYGTTGGYTLDLDLDGTITGSGSVNVIRGASGTSHQRDLYLYGDFSGYSGSWTNTGAATGTTAGTLNVYAAGVSGWGSSNMTLNAYANLTISGALTNPATRLNLNNASATLTVNGAATVGSLISVASSTATINNSLTLADNTSTTIAGTLTGAGALNKKGTGTLTIPNLSLNTATSTVSAGTLIAAGNVGSLTMNAGSTLAPGAAALTAGTLSVGGNLTFNTNILNLDISSSTSGGNDSIGVSGNLTLNGVTTVNLNLLNGSAAAGPYTVLTYSGTLTGGATNFSIVGSHSATFDFSTPNQVNLWFTNGAPRNLVWVGDGTANAWDAGTSFTWFNGTGADYFGQGDNVTFNDTATNLTANVTGILSPGTFVVTNFTNSYVLQGSGTISGGASLLKGGTAALTVSNANAFSGGTTISAGTIFARGATAPLGTGAITLGDGNTGTNTAALYTTYKNTFTNAITVTATGTGNAIIGSDQNGGASGNATTISSPITLNQSLAIDSGNQLDRLHIGGVITGTGNITLFGGHRIDLGAANTFTGTLHIQGSGTLFETFAGGCVPSASTVDVGPGSIFGVYISQTIDALTNNGLVEPYGGNSTLTLGSAGGSGTFGGVITNYNATNTVTIIKTGSGTETFNGGDYSTAATTINGGTLALGTAGFITNSPLITVASGATYDVSALGGSYALNPGQTLAGNGNVNGSFNTLSNAVLAPGGTGVAGTLTFNNNLTLAGNSVLALDLTGNTTVGGSVNDLIYVSGNLNLTGTNIIAIPAASQQALVTGTYQLINYSGTLTGGATNFIISPVLTRLTLTVDTSTPNQVNLIVSGGSASNLAWVGGLNGNTWDVATSSNWFNGTSPDIFYQQDGVLFNALGATNPVVTIATTLYPSAVSVVATNNYTFTGAGQLAGAMALGKDGSGTLYLQTTNTFAGGITVTNGTVELDTTLAGGSGAITLGNNTLNVNIAGGTLSNTVTGGGTINVIETASAGTTISSPLYGFTGTINLPASPGGTAKAIITSGAVSLQNGTTINITNGGTFYVTGSAVTIPSTINLAGGGNSEGYGALRVDSSASLTGPVNLLTNSSIGVYTGSSTISGNISDGGKGYALYKTGSGTLTFNGTNYYTGPTVVTNGTVNVNGNQTTATGGWSLPYNYNASTVNFESGSTILVATNGYVQIGSSPAAGTPGNQTLNDSGTVTNNGTLLIGRGGWLNVNSGGIWVQNGAFSDAPPSASGYSAYVTVNAGGILQYTGTNTIKLEPSSGNAGLGYFTNSGVVITSRGFERTINTSAANPLLVLNGGVIQLTTNIPALTTSSLVTTGGVLSVVLTGSGGVIDTYGFSTTVSNVISGSGGLTKMSPGTLTLPYTNTYTGATVVSNGTLVVNGKLAPASSLTVAASAVLAGTGNIGGPATIQTGGTVLATAGTLTVSNLTLGTVSTDLTTNSFTLGAGGLIAAPTLSIYGTNVVNILDASLTVGTNNLITYTGTINGLGIAGFVLGTLPPYTTGYLQDSGTAVQLVVTSAGVPPSVTVTPATTNVYALSTVTFTASASGTAPLTLQWFDNHTNAIAGATNATLTLTNLAVGQSGHYTVAVTNVAGSTSAYGTLTVNTLVSPALTNAVTLPDGTFQLTFSGPAGETYKVLATTNLTQAVTSWSVLTNGVFGAGAVTFVDPAATNQPQRFYLITAP